LDVTANTGLSAGEYTYDNVIVRNSATLTLNGNPATNAGVVIHATTVTVMANSFISADATGFPAGQGPGAAIGTSGGGYGGQGGPSGAAGASYGSAISPADLGSGGGNGAGSGAIRLDVTGTLTVDGAITASGSGDAGGGSGGSIWITTGTIAGAGTLKADGGYGSNYYCYGQCGGGSGGRIAVHYRGSCKTPRLCH
jgi:hypothetical protein